MLNIFGEAPPKTVFISEEQLYDTTQTELYGKYYPKSEIYNIFPKNLEKNGELLGVVTEESDADRFHGRISGDKIFFLWE